MTKPEVRERARQHGLALAEKADSQEICFVPGGDYKAVSRRLPGRARRVSIPAAAGELVTTTGEVIGEHNGIHNFTVGQRKGLGVATGSPLYVIQIKGDQRKVVVGNQDELYSRILTSPPCESHFAVENLATRTHAGDGQESAIATKELRLMIEKSGNDEVLVTFDEPQRAITPGQAAVFYEGDVVVGGSWIT